MKQLKPTSTSKYDDKEDHVYYDVNYFNSTNTNQPLNISDSRTLPLIKNPNDYHFSIVRFNCPTQYLPIFIWPQNAGGTGADNALYSITLTGGTGATGSQQFLTYVPNNNLPPSNPNYYFVYSYQNFVDSINVALNNAFIAIGMGSANQPPYMIYNPITGLFSIIAEYNYGTSLGEYKLYFNQPLFAFFDNFHSIATYPMPVALGKDYQIIIENTGVAVQSFAPNYTQAVSNNAFQITQENYTLYLFNSVRKLIFCSSIPVISENLNVADQQLNTTSNNSLKILTDFEVSLTTGSDWRSYQQYIPVGEYRLITMNSDTPLYKFDFQILFQTADQSVYQLHIIPGESFSMKCMFRNKHFKSGL